MQDRWLACTQKLESEVSTQLYKTWIKPLTYLGYDESEHILRLGAPNQFKLNWVKNQFGNRINELAGHLINPRTTVVYEISTPAGLPSGALATARSFAPTNGRPNSLMQGRTGESGHGPGQSGHAGTQSQPQSGDQAGSHPVDLPNGHATSRPAVSVAGTASHLSSKLQPNLTFETFVTGRSNQMARAAALQVAERPGTSYNPLFLYGGVGLGKTHLIHAVGNAILGTGKRVRYVHAQEYFEEMVRAIQRKSDDWKSSYHSLDLLLIDDIQFLAGKQRTQEEFFYTFDALATARKQMIITCDTYPKEMTGVEERLISRFDSGLIVAIEPPDLETRVAILHKKAEQSGADVPDDVAFFVAKHLRSNVRELEGALLRVVAFAGFRNRPITLDLAKEALDDLLSLNRRHISIEVVQKEVADLYKIKVADMFSKRRHAHIVLPRQVAMYLAKELTQKSLPEIGEAFGGRDHTTVLHAVRKIAEQRQHDSELNHQIHVLEQTLRG